MLIALLAVPAMIAFFISWIFLCKLDRTVYSGPAQVVHAFHARGGGSMLAIQIPDQVGLMTAFVPSRRDLSNGLRPVEITITKSFLRAPRVTLVKYSDVGAERCTETNLGLIPALLYFAVAGGLLVATLHFGLGRSGCLTTAFALHMSGFAMSYYRITPEIINASSTYLGPFRLSGGVKGWGVAVTVLTVATVLCFWSVSFLMLIPGATCAFELGYMMAIVFCWSWNIR